MLWQNLKLALASIRSAKLRSFLTMLGIIIGVAAVLMMISIGDGVKKQVSGQISDLGTNILTLTSGKIGNSNTSGGQRGGGLAGSFGTSTLTDKDLQTVKATNHVLAVAPIELVSGIVAHNNTTAQGVNVVATTSDYINVRKIDIAEGTFFSSRDDIDQNYVVVLGANSASSLFENTNAIGQDVLIRGQKFKVVGVIERSDEGGGGISSAGSSDDIVYIPFSSATRLTGASQILRIMLKVDDPTNVTAVKHDLERTIKENHGGQDDFSVLTQEDLLGMIGSILDLLTTFVAAIASISLLVGGIGIMNIMLVSVTERTREIGIRKAIGATFSNIMGQFLMEAVMLSLMGGLIGVAFAYIASFPIKKFASITPVFSIKAIMLAFGVSVAIGIIFGVAPAIKAARKRPIQALKAL